MTLVCWLADVGKNDGARVGGKGANLGELLRAGLPVPPGFVLTTAAYRHFVAANALGPEIERLARPAPADDPAALEGAARAIGGLFASGAMPAEIARATREAYLRLQEPPVAVRSSATAEDLPGASFAGQMETYLKVRGTDALLAAVRRCWASLWTARAIAYRANQGVAPAEVGLAVVVQEQLPAEAAGVLFTANPVSGRRDQMVIDGSWGLGEAVVGGRVTPDHWLVDARTGAVLEARVVCKKLMTATQGPGTALVPVPGDLREKPALDEAQLAALVDLGRRAAGHFGSPQDVEWALARGRLYLVQSRPITSLFPLPRPEPSAAAGERVYLSFNITQGVGRRGRRTHCRRRPTRGAAPPP
jgi:pyruvate,water dikinase